jgi:hypothetical protein
VVTGRSAHVVQRMRSSLRQTGPSSPPFIPGITLTPSFDAQIKRRGREARVARDDPSGGPGADPADEGPSGDDGGSDEDDYDGEEPFSGEESHGA